ncbi:1,4-dihydroxy-2-naphthoate prenyltransferase [Glaciihabitans arcticus]|uniref:1,4-dihydroxy-2-naphthoate prenyltransferase n=1 Tax=Glaciihabitans arcticus TaxID=2668039 RepID=A0A4V2JEV9_9MICO|nr:UbiA family prenyltransferase [Glaciihabitans arcticus]TBN57009.1 1,4-dihydroxy-2-naphthoate prenyltransferase [Glaciihabitans arcticus]
MERTPSRPVAILLSSHPGPAFAVTTVTIVLGIGVGLEPWRVALLGLAMLLGQFSVGLSNDWLDAQRDAAVGRSDKPIARGWVAASSIRTIAFVTAALAIVLTAPLGALVTLAHTVFIASAWSYNAGLKKTAFSVLPYIVSFGSLPLLATLALPQPAPAAWWGLGAGALLGVSAHFANVLPDLVDDAATGVRGLPHRLGSRASGLVIAVALAASALLVAFGAGQPPLPAQWIGLALTLALAVLAGGLAAVRAPTRLLFQLIIAAALVIVAMLALSGTRLIA